LKIIAGIYQPNEGSVTVNGRLVPFIELGVGFNPDLTGRENVYLNGALMGFSESEIDTKYEAIVAFAELERFMDQKLKNYSSGMQVRLAFSVATILADSEILLIDEVLAVGDADFQRKCFEYFKKLKKEKKTVIFVSHDMAAIREYCDRAVLIDKSKVIFRGSADEVAKEYTKLFHPEVHAAEEEARKEELRQAQHASKQEGKWGSGGLDITKPQLDKSVYTLSDKSISFEYEIKKKTSLKGDIIPGFTVKNEQGAPVFGTNTDILLDKKRVSFKPGAKTMTVAWTFPNIFNQGSYTIDPAILSAENGETLQWWDEAISFSVINEKSTPYPVTPIIKVKINN
jgi:ABC-2 type transport system ATP-binding protein